MLCHASSYELVPIVVIHEAEAQASEPESKSVSCKRGRLYMSFAEAIGIA